MKRTEGEDDDSVCPRCQGRLRQEAVGQVLGPGTGGSICVHVGTNDADKEGTTAIVGKFRALVRELKARRVGKIWISGILPVIGGKEGVQELQTDVDQQPARRNV